VLRVLISCPVSFAVSRGSTESMEFVFALLESVSWFIPGIGDDTTPIPIFGQPIYSLSVAWGWLY